jgi:hypothetical protein
MKVVMTGGGNSLNPSHFLGKWLFEMFDNTVQLSRTTGYDFNKNYDEIVKEARTADLFINCACVDDYQIKLLEDVYGYVPNMLVIGSISGDFYQAMDIPYAKIKHDLKKRCKMIPLEHKTSATNLLHLTVTEVEDLANNKEGINKNQLKDLIEFWLRNPIMANIDLKFFIGEHFLTGEKLEKVNRVLEFYAKN